MDLIPTGCPLCGNKAGRLKLEFQPPDLDQKFIIHDCLACGASYINPRLAAHELTAFFSNPSIYRKSTDPEGRSRSLALERDLKRREFGEYAGQVKKLIPGGRALDAGCGLGLFLGAAWTRV